MNKVLFKDAFARDNSSPEDEQCFIFENDKFRECSCTNVMITSSIESPCRRFIDLWKGKLVVMKDIPNNQHITYQLQFRKCGKASCSTCRDGQGHGPYWYAYWREGSRLRSGYVGKVHPNQQKPSTSPRENEAMAAELTPKEYIATPALI